MLGAWQRQACHLRDMTEADLLQVAPIERRAYPFPWPTDFFRHCLREGFVCRVLEQDRMILGYGILALEKDQAHIINLCVRPEFQGRGHGTRLLQHLLNLARRHGARYALLEVRPSKSRPGQGMIKLRTTTLNQDGEAVQVTVGNLIVSRRPAER